MTTTTPILTSAPHPPDCLCSICGIPESLRLKRGPLRVEAIAADSIFNQAYGAGAKAIMDGKRRLVAIVLGPEALSVPDAELIVRAVNNHDELVEACQAALDIERFTLNEKARASVGQIDEALKWTAKINQIHEQINAALAKAQPQEADNDTQS